MADDKPRGGLFSRLFGPRPADTAPEPEPLRPLDWDALGRPAPGDGPTPDEGPEPAGRHTDRLPAMDAPLLEAAPTETVETALPMEALERELPDETAAADARAEAAPAPEPARQPVTGLQPPWPEVPRPEALRPEALRPEGRQPGTPQPARPEPVSLDPALPEPSRPDASRPDASRPWWNRGAGREPDAPSRPETSRPEPDTSGRGWFGRLRSGLTRSSTALQGGIGDLFKKQLDVQAIEDLEDVLIQADLGLDVALRITREVGTERFARGASPEAIRRVLAAEVQRELEPVAVPLAIDRTHKPFVVLMVGVNGSGKTTTIGKLAAKFSGQGLNVTMAAGDTFRAAAIEQLQVWGKRTGSPVVARQQGADAAGLVFDAMAEARQNGSDVLLVDTAGRLQNRAELMDELAKVVRVLKKADASAPHAVLLVLDATVGQNALAQVEAFRTTAGVTGLVMTKLDGTARGGILVALAARFKLPVHFIGVGEGVEDLEPFSARDFAHAIAGLD